MRQKSILSPPPCISNLPVLIWGLNAEVMLMSSTLDFDSIRPVGGSVQDGFEELCCQIARLYDEVPEDSRFTKKGFRDSGIECLWELPNGETWGWQAKFLVVSQSALDFSSN